MEKRELLCSVGRNVNWYSHYGKQYGCYSEIKNRTTLWSTKFTSGYLSKEILIPIPKKGSTNECSNYRTIALISHASKVMLKILQASLQQYVNFQMFMLDFEKAKRSNCQHMIQHHWKIKRVPEKYLFLLYWLRQSLVWITTNYRKFIKRWEYQTTWPASWEICT